MEFDKRLEQIAKKVMSEDRRPSTGIWYYIYLKPNWKLEVYKATEMGEGIGHVDIWRDYTSHQIAEYYNVKQSDISDVHLSMPRGRVDHIPKGMLQVVGLDEIPGHYYAYFGNDVPSSLDQDKEKHRIISGFNLHNFAVRNMVHFVSVPHETMNKNDIDNLQKVLNTEIPY